MKKKRPLSLWPLKPEDAFGGPYEGRSWESPQENATRVGQTSQKAAKLQYRA